MDTGSQAVAATQSRLNLRIVGHAIDASPLTRPMIGVIIIAVGQMGLAAGLRRSSYHIRPSSFFISSESNRTECGTFRCGCLFFATSSLAKKV
jgi:hypothetical protein